MSKLRAFYFGRLTLRTAVFVAALALYFTGSNCFDVLNGAAFFEKFTILHIVWVIWVFDMLWQLVPAKVFIPLGSQKLFNRFYVAAPGGIDSAALRRNTVEGAKAAAKVFVVYAVMIGAICLLYIKGILSTTHLFLISTAFYVCDLICVLIWCPFRVMMGNRCCTTCRIFNWDHLMMFTPMLLVNGFYSRSLLLMAFAVWLLWEITAYMHPERFSEQTNVALRCSECTDKLCGRK